jgi:hypothetical protein
MIIHHPVPVGQNSHAFISLYSKVNSTWATKRLADPNTPWFAISEVLKPAKGWSVDEVLLGKTRVGSFGDSVLLGYLRAGDVKREFTFPVSFVIRNGLSSLRRNL